MEINGSTLDRLNENTLYRAMGIRMEEAAGGKACSRLVPDQNHCWPFPGQPHGGVLFTLMDTTMALAVCSRLDPGHGCATIHLDIQYTSPAKGNIFSCNASVSYRTGRLSFVYSEIRDEEDQIVAMGQGNFRIIKFDLLA
jgi:uncharacterized protein (TIGR00369 family)